MKVLVIGGGGKEHAIAWKLSRSRHISKVYCCPGNPGIADIAELIDVRSNDYNALIDFVKYEWIDFTIIGSGSIFSQEVASLFEKEGCRIFGAGRISMQVEASRVFAKNLMRLHRVPTPEYKVFSSYLEAEDYVRLKGAPIIIKIDGRLADNGIFRAKTVEEAIEILEKIMRKRIFGDAGNQVIIEEDVKGKKFTLLTITDGKTLRPLTTLSIYRNLYARDQGPATKGMGAYSPAHSVEKELIDGIMDKIMHPLAKSLGTGGIPHKGFLSADLNENQGTVTVLGFNGTFCDPDTQAVLPRLKTDIVDMALAIMEERLNDMTIEWEHEASICLALVSKGYPGNCTKDEVIAGLEQARQIEDVVVFHEGTTFYNNTIRSAGGRVLSITAAGKTLDATREKAYTAAELIHFNSKRFRKDIGILS